MDERAQPVPEPPGPAWEGGRFGSFQDLMRWRADNIVLVSSLYDAFILAEDGHLNELILGEFLGLNLSHIPNLVRASTGQQALDAVRDRAGHSVVISAPFVGDMDVRKLARRMEQEGLEAPVALLGFDNRELTEYLRRQGLGKVDRAFLWQGDLHLVLAIVKYMEDRLNVAHDVETLGVQAIIVIDDNIRYYSSFLPMIYAELAEHTRSLLPEGVNLSHKLLRIRARPKILLCSTYEEAWEHLSRYQANILGVISDIEFPKDGALCPDAGVQFARQVRETQPDVPVLLHSGRPENERRAREVGASFLLKGSPTLLTELRHFMLENFGFGDFVFRLPDGTEVGRAHDLRSLEEEIQVVPAESLAHHGARNHFSVWLKAHTEFEVAHRLRPRKVSDFDSLEDLRELLVDAIRKHRRQRSRAAVTDFHPETWDLEAGFSRIGGGSLGGKARGLAFANQLLVQYDLEDRFEDVRITVPPCVVIGTDVFDEFLALNDLLDFAVTAEADAEILERFRSSEFPEEARESLRAFVERCSYPLAVRSSSLLEDHKYQPFAGIYETQMLPNNDPDPEVRLRQLLRAVVDVYASTFSEQAKRHVISTPYRLEEEKMAVILQRLVGAVHGDRFYPEFAGVAMSQNYYPTGPARPEDGIASVALGLGPTVVEGETCLQFSPPYPEHIVQFSSVEDTLDNSQREFYALRLDGGGRGDTDKPGDGGARGGDASPEEAAGEPPTMSGTARLGKFGLDVAKADGTLEMVGSTYVPQDERIYDGVSRPGTPLVTFAPILKHGAFPLPDILQTLLRIGIEATGVPVEIEFAVDASTLPDRPADFALLQLRPVSPWVSQPMPEVGDVDEERVVCHSDSVLGTGILDDVRDVIVVDYHRFERGKSHEVARQVARLNAELVQAGASYLLIGVGRWGSSEPYLGIPVTWGQISGARAIVEAGFRDFKVAPSQGTHFFQNLTSHKVGYFTVNPEAGQGFVDWDWLAAQPPETDAGVVRHLRFDEPLVVLMNGETNEGAIFKPGQAPELELLDAMQ